MFIQKNCLSKKFLPPPVPYSNKITRFLTLVCWKYILLSNSHTSIVQEVQTTIFFYHKMWITSKCKNLWQKWFFSWILYIVLALPDFRCEKFKSWLLSKSSSELWETLKQQNIFKSQPSPLVYFHYETGTLVITWTPQNIIEFVQL